MSEFGRNSEENMHDADGYSEQLVQLYNALDDTSQGEVKTLSEIGQRGSELLLSLRGKDVVSPAKKAFYKAILVRSKVVPLVLRTMNVVQTPASHELRTGPVNEEPKRVLRHLVKRLLGRHREQAPK